MNKKLIIRFLVFVVIIFSLDFVIGKLLNYYYFKPNTKKHAILYSMEKTNEDILFFGSSRAQHHYKPALFEKAFSHSCYNNGLGGMHIPYYYITLKSTVNRYTPKLVVLDINNYEFKVDQETDIYLLLPYYKTHPEIQPAIDMLAPAEKYKMLISRIYPFNSLLYGIISNNLVPKTNVAFDGYDPLRRKMKSPVKTEIYETYPIDNKRVALYESFIKDCIENKVPLVIVQSPYYTLFKGEDASISIAKDIAKKYNITFFDFSQDTSFTNHSLLFADERHLNDSGATILSNRLIDSIRTKNLLLNK